MGSKPLTYKGHLSLKNRNVKSLHALSAQKKPTLRKNSAPALGGGSNWMSIVALTPLPYQVFRIWQAGKLENFSGRT